MNGICHILGKHCLYIMLLDCLIKLLLNPAPWKVLLLHSGVLEYFPSIQKFLTEDEFLPSTVTDQVQNVYSGETNIDASVLDTTEAAVQSTSTPASSNPGCSLEAVPETSLIESIAPLPKARPRKIRRRKRVSSAIITPVKKRLFPQQSGDSSTDEKEVFADSESNASLFDGDSSLSPQTDKLVILKCGGFVYVHTAAGNCKKFIGKLVSGPDEDEDFEISFLERSRKIKNGFVFPEMEDLASIGKKDIEKIFPPPHAAAQTKRLCGVMKFNVDLSYV